MISSEILPTNQETTITTENKQTTIDSPITRLSQQLIQNSNYYLLPNSNTEFSNADSGDILNVSFANDHGL